MKKIVWEIEYLSLPPVIKYCKKCREKKAFICSGQFRVNAQRKSLDIWLIYKCSSCDTTWNATLYSRISPQSLNHELLEAFHRNDEMLIEQFAMNADLLHKIGVEIGLPSYAIIGEDFSTTEAVTLEIKSKYFVHVKVSAIIREKLHLSQKDYLQLIDNGKIRSIPDLDLHKCRLKNGIHLFLIQINHIAEQKIPYHIFCDVRFSYLNAIGNEPLGCFEKIKKVQERHLFYLQCTFS